MSAAEAPLLVSEPPRGLVGVLRALYDGDSATARRFRRGLLAFDAATVLFIVGTSFYPDPRPAWIEVADPVFGVLALADYLARLLVSRQRLRDALHPVAVADLVAIASFLVPMAGEGAGFLRVLRTLRLVRDARVLDELRRIPWFRANEEAAFAATNLLVFVFVMTGVVYATQHFHNPHIRNYADALYFTITSLTTTGFGDITLPGTTGRMISVVIMLAGITFFLRLAQVLFRPHKVRFGCPSCGLLRHDPDAVHCKACGVVLCIPDEGE